MLVEDTGVSNTVAGELVGGEEAEGTETVLDGDTDKVVSVRVDELGEVVLTVACAITAAIE